METMGAFDGEHFRVDRRIRRTLALHMRAFGISLIDHLWIEG